jgi:hypothetical protein
VAQQPEPAATRPSDPFACTGVCALRRDSIRVQGEPDTVPLADVAMARWSTAWTYGVVGFSVATLAVAVVELGIIAKTQPDTPVTNPAYAIVPFGVGLAVGTASFVVGYRCYPYGIRRGSPCHLTPQHSHDNALQVGVRMPLSRFPRFAIRRTP